MSVNDAGVAVSSAPSKSDIKLLITFERFFSVELALSSVQLSEVMALRYQVYCREREFEDAESFPDGRERDAYDPRSVHALVRHRQSGKCVAAVRLVLADQEDPDLPFPVEKHCRDALPAAGMAELGKIPRARIAEVSRLAISREMRQHIAPKRDNVATLDEHQISPYIVVGLFSAIVQWSAELGISHWLAVMEPACLRMLRRYGIRFSHTGDITVYHGRRRPVVAGARAMLDDILRTRTDVWHLITGSGSVVPDHAPAKQVYGKYPAAEIACPAAG